MKTLNDFKKLGAWKIGTAGEGYEIDTETFEELEEIANVEYDQEGRYCATDANGEEEYFYCKFDCE